MNDKFWKDALENAKAALEGVTNEAERTEVLRDIRLVLEVMKMDMIHGRASTWHRQVFKAYKDYVDSL